MPRPLRKDSSSAFKAPSCSLMEEMYERACEIGVASLNGPLVSNSSARAPTFFLKSSAEFRSPVLNFSCNLYRPKDQIYNYVCTVNVTGHTYILYLVFLQHGR